MHIEVAMVVDCCRWRCFATALGPLGFYLLRSHGSSNYRVRNDVPTLTQDSTIISYTKAVTCITNLHGAIANCSQHATSPHAPLHASSMSKPLQITSIPTTRAPTNASTRTIEATNKNDKRKDDRVKLNPNPHFQKLSANTSNSVNNRTPRSTRKDAKRFLHR